MKLAAIPTELFDSADLIVVSPGCAAESSGSAAGSTDGKDAYQ